ncbi:UbiA prenyltransferase family [Mycena epipterygia]|nr:UbiA prenyltransferase family [Mycena epipterygia]
MYSLMRTLRDGIYTAFLFNEHDIISTISPVVAFLSSLAPFLLGSRMLNPFLHGLVWQELHLIAFEITHQITGVEEDKLSKPTHPLVSGRLTVQTAQRIYLALIVLSLLNSVSHGILACSSLHLVSMFAYEGGLSRDWALKSFIGSMGYVCYCWGMTVIFGEQFFQSTITELILPDHGRPLSQTSIIAVVLSGLIFTTTALVQCFPNNVQGHAQDFRDREGDAAIGHKTLAFVLPQTFARWSLILYFWGPPMGVAAMFFALATYTSVRFILDYSEEADGVSYWCV